MKILHLEASPGWGGQEIRIVKEAEGMRNRGHQLFFGVQKKGKIVSELRKRGFFVYQLNFRKPYWFQTFFKLLWILLRRRIDIINTHSSLDSWIGGLAGRFFRRPIIRTRHLSTRIRKGWNSRLLYKWLADYVVTTCQKIVPIISEQSGQSLVHCLSVPTGIDTASTQITDGQALDFRKKYDISSDDFLVGMVCFMRSWKGIEAFLKAAKIMERDSKVKFILIGGGHEKTYREKAERMGLKNFIFTGHLKDPLPGIAALDVFSLLSTAHEGVSQSSLQAAFLQKPLITTTTGGLPEVCIEGKTGLQVPLFSASSVAKAVTILKADPILKKRMGEKARKLILEKFTMQKMLDHMEKVYQKAKDFSR